MQPSHPILTSKVLPYVVFPMLNQNLTPNAGLQILISKFLVYAVNLWSYSSPVHNIVHFLTLYLIHFLKLYLISNVPIPEG
jgi:hypothetical protein